MLNAEEQHRVGAVLAFERIVAVAQILLEDVVAAIPAAIFQSVVSGLWSTADTSCVRQPDLRDLALRLGGRGDELAALALE